MRVKMMAKAFLSPVIYLQNKFFTKQEKGLPIGQPFLLFSSVCEN